METMSQNLHSHLGRKVTCAPVLVALGLSPNFKSSYPSFPERVGLKGDRQDRPAARRVLSGARGAPAGRSCASSSSGSGPPPGLCPRVVEGFEPLHFGIRSDGRAGDDARKSFYAPLVPLNGCHAFANFTDPADKRLIVD